MSSSTETSGSRWALAGPVVFVLGQLDLLRLPDTAARLIAALRDPDLFLTMPLDAFGAVVGLIAYELILGAILGASLLVHRPRGRTIAAYAGVTVALGAAVVALIVAEVDLWLVALGLGVSIAALAYLLHRLALVRLGLVAGGEPA